MTQAHTVASQEDLTENGEFFPKAVKRAAKFLRLSADELANIICVSPNTAKRILAGENPRLGVKATGRAIQLISVWRAVDGLAKGDSNMMLSWFNCLNNDLEAIPRDLIQTEGGLERILAWFYGPGWR